MFIVSVPTDLESEELSGKSGNLVGGPGKIACIIRLSNCCCNVASGQAFHFIFNYLIGFLIIYCVIFKSKALHIRV